LIAGDAVGHLACLSLGLGLPVEQRLALGLVRVESGAKPFDVIARYL
jgi:hypothetical protein